MSLTQTNTQKMGEVIFRRKLTSYFLGKAPPPGSVPTAQQEEKEAEDIVRRTIEIFQRLNNKGVIKEPFLDIGSASCLRSIALLKVENINGYALDISLDALTFAHKIYKRFRPPRLPQRICGDINNLPFADNSIPFIFTFQTLHHFPDPEPVFKEIYRILSPGGYFFFAEEPIRQIINLRLWKRGYRLNIFEKILKKIFLLPFVSDIGASEEAFGALENSFSLSTWERSLHVFDHVDAVTYPFRFGTKDKLTLKQFAPSTKNRFLLALLGGGISALCFKSGFSSLKERYLSCPVCKKPLKEEISYHCTSCNIQYPRKHDIIQLLPPRLKRTLYP